MQRAAAREPIIRVERVGKAFRGQQVLSDLDLTLYSGETTLLLGKNGSGKSTLLKIAAGLLTPTSGRVEALHDGAIGFISHKPLLYSELSVLENLRFFASLCPDAPDPRRAMDDWRLSPHQDKPAGELSKGLQFRLSAARAFLNSPTILLLDEPTAALDDESLEMLLKAVKRRTNEGGTSLIATHDVSRAFSAADRILVLDSGRVGFDTDSSPENPEKAKTAAVDLYRAGNR